MMGRMTPRDRSSLWRQVAATTSVPHAHAHADSRHRRPLWDALTAGFTSLEVDVWVVGGRILVGHSAPSPLRSLRRLYLDPLAAMIRETGCVHSDSSEPITLLLDVKSNPRRARPVIEATLRRYSDLVSSWQDGRFAAAGVTVIVSGTLSEQLYDAPHRWTGVDGRVRRTGLDVTADLMPLRSDCWPELFSWRGVGQMPADQRVRLDRMVADAHSRGQRVRFWDTPDRPGPARDTLWATLLDAGVDHLDTDDLSGARDFLRARAPRRRG